MSSQKEFVDSVNLKEPLCGSDHNKIVIHLNIKMKSDKAKVSQRRKSFRKGNYKENVFWAHIDWNDKMEDKTTTESWNILTSELDSVINGYVSTKKHGKRPNISVKRGFQKDYNFYINNMWRVYKHRGNRCISKVQATF